MEHGVCSPSITRAKVIVTPYLPSYNVRLNPQLVVKGCLTWTMESAHLQSPVPRDLNPPYLLSSYLRLNPQLAVRGQLTWTVESAHPQFPLPKDLNPPYLLSSDLRLNP